jgi:predicted RNase H-like HicB family nuclease
MKSAEIIRRLKKYGLILHNVRGSHHQFKHPRKKGRSKEEIMNYPVVIHKDKDSDYGVTVPDLPGCFSAGESMEDALENAAEAILCHAEGMMMDGQPIPPPTSIENYRNDDAYKDGIWALVTVDFSKISGKAKRVNITIPERLLAQVDNFARRKGETRSGLFLSAAMEYMAHHGAARPQ